MVGRVISALPIVARRALTVLTAVAFLTLLVCLAPSFGQAQSLPAFSSGTLNSGSGAGSSVSVNTSGQNACRANFTNSSSFIGTIQIGLISLGDTTVTYQTVYDDGNNSYTSITGVGSFTVYVKSAATVTAKVTSYTGGSIVANINCTNASGQNIPTPQPLQTDSSQNLTVNTENSNVTVSNAIVPEPTPGSGGVLPTPAVPVMAKTQCQYSSTLPSISAGNLNYEQCGKTGILYMSVYSLLDPCADYTQTPIFFSLTYTTAATGRALNPSSLQYAHVCSLRISVSTAVTITVTEGTGTGCGTSTVTVTSYQLQSGIVIHGLRELYPGLVQGDSVCYATGGTSNVTVEGTGIVQ